MRPVVTLLSIVVLAGCASEKSYVEIPACADRVEVEGQGERLNAHRFELYHTFDLPFSKTVMSFEIRNAQNSGQWGAPQTFDVVSTQPDALRLFVGAGVGLIGGLLLGGALYDVWGQGRSLLEERPFYESIWGSGLFALGAAGVLTGWHPSHQTFIFPDVCPTPKSETAQDPEVFQR